MPNILIILESVSLTNEAKEYSEQPLINDSLI